MDLDGLILRSREVEERATCGNVNGFLYLQAHSLQILVRHRYSPSASCADVVVANVVEIATRSSRAMKEMETLMRATISNSRTQTS